MNESDENLLSFCAMNELIVMNTMFEKTSVFKYTTSWNKTLALY